MTDRALVVGINKYPESPLRGCVNDANDIADFLNRSCGFAANDVRMLIDRRATAAAIRKRLEWLIEGAAPGDRIVFHYSGHGTQMATRDPNGEVDQLDEVICPVDFDWTDEHAIRDKDFRALFSRIPAGVNFVWISDSCHSGDLTRLAPGATRGARTGNRYLEPPADIAWRIRAAREKAMGSRTLQRTATALNLAFISGCESDQTSADAVINGRSCGALTHFLLARLGGGDGLNAPLTTIVKDVNSALDDNGYEQNPQLEGATSHRDAAFLGVGAPQEQAPVAIEVQASKAAAEVPWSELRPGDVLLYRGDGWLSRAIRLLDGTPVSHAGLYVGNGLVAEALGEGLIERPIAASVAGREWVLARRLALPQPSAPVTTVAQHYVSQGNRYAYEQIVLLAFLAISRRVRPTPILGALIRRVLDAAASVVNGWVSTTTAPGRQPMICSEFVYRCYDEADERPEDAYTLVVNPFGARGRRAGDSARGTGVQRGSVIETLARTGGAGRQLQVRKREDELRSTEDLFEQYELELARGERAEMEDVAASVQEDVTALAYQLQRVAPAGTRRSGDAGALDALFATVKDFVTPGDLLHTRSLADAGRVPVVQAERVAAPANLYAEAWQRANLPMLEI